MNFHPLWRYQNQFLAGTSTTLALTVIAATVGLAIGLVGGNVMRGGPRPLRMAFRAYVEVFRNTPSLIQIFVIFFVLPAVGLRLPAFEAAAVALSLYFGAYSVEIVRTGLGSIPRSQVEAGRCLGLTPWQVLRHVVLPPAMRNVYPAFTSQFVLLLLGTSLASQISVDDLFHAAGYVESRTYRSFEVYAIVCAIYFVLVIVFKATFFGLGRALFRWPVRR